MSGKRGLLLVAAVLLGVALARATAVQPASATTLKDEAQYEYKVVVASYNPGERMTDHERAAAYERTLNEQARLGWEPVSSLLSRDTVQTVGGAVTTRDTTAFFTYRRLKR